MMDGVDYKSAISYLSEDKLLLPFLSQDLPVREPTKDVYSGLLRSIVSQQLSVKAAATIHGRFLQLFENENPTAVHIDLLTDEELRAVGLSGQKAKYIRNVAAHFTDHQLFNFDWSTLSDEEIIELLTEIKGVGRWTVEMILMFVLKRSDVFPVLDLGIQKGMKHIYGLTSEKKVLYQEMTDLAESWRPYRTVGCLYLWEVSNTLPKK